MRLENGVTCCTKLITISLALSEVIRFIRLVPYWLLQTAFCLSIIWIWKTHRESEFASRNKLRLLDVINHPTSANANLRPSSST